MSAEGWDCPRFAGDSARNDAGDSANNDEALWPLLVEKAAIKAFGGDYLALNVGTGAMSMTMLTGNPAVDDIITPNTPWDTDAIAKYSALSHDDNVMMTANSNVGSTEKFEVPVKFPDNPNGQTTFSNNHVYQVSEIDSKGNVTLVNPWNANPANGGVDHDAFTITAAQFNELFIGVSIGTIH